MGLANRLHAARETREAQPPEGVGSNGSIARNRATNRATNRRASGADGRLTATGIFGQQDEAESREMASELRFCPLRASQAGMNCYPIPSTQQGISGL